MRAKTPAIRWLSVGALLAAGGCSRPAPDTALTGAWRVNVQFADGAFAAVHDLRFLTVFNAGGTMTESSNYDGAPPVPPAYGAWRQVGPRRFEAHYEFWVTRPPGSFADVAAGGGWLPAGRGLLDETIELSADGNAYTSSLVYAALDSAGGPAPGGGKASASAVRVGFAPPPAAR